MSDERWSDEALVAAREAWPAIELAPETFREHLAQKEEQLTGRSSHRDLRTSDLYFALACAQRDASALGLFDAMHSPMLARVFARLKLPDAIAADLGAELRELLFFGPSGAAPLILDYSGRGALAAWLRSVAIHRALKAKRDGRRHVEADASFPALATADDPEQAFLRRAHSVAFEAALEVALRSLSARERNVLRQHHLDGLTIDELGALYGVHRATSARWIADARNTILASVRTTLVLSMSPSEADSVLRATKDDLELRVSSLLRAGD